MSFITGLDKKLEGAPEAVLTVGLLIASLIGILVAVFGTPTLKAATLAWMAFP